MHILEYIKDYKVSSKSPTDEFLTLWRFFSEIGGYASTIFDKNAGVLRNYAVSGLKRLSVNSGGLER